MASFMQDEAAHTFGTSGQLSNHSFMTAAFTFRQCYAAPEDWEAHTDIIKDLYLTQKKPLKEVIKIMARKYNFHATAKMYKRYLKRRGLDSKNVRAQDVIEILRIKQRGDSAQKQSEFFVRGRRLDSGKIQRYLKRNPSVMAQIRSEILEKRDLPGSPRIVCHTPAEDSAVTLSVSPLLDATDDLRVLEKVVRATLTYAEGALEDARWLLEDSGKLLVGRGGYSASQRLDCWESGTIEALELIRNNNIQHGFRVLGLCLDRTPVILRDEDPELLSKMAKITLYIPKEKQDLFQAIQRHFSNISAAVLGQTHPITLFWAYFSANNTPGTHYSVKVTLEALIFGLEKSTGVTQTSFTLRRRLIRFSKCGGFLSSQETEWELRKLISLGLEDVSASVTWEDIFRAGIDLCAALQSSYNLTRAEGVLRTLCNWNSRIPLESRYGRLHYEYLWVLLRMCSLYEELNIASQVSTSLLELCEELYGIFDCKTLCALQRVQEILVRQGRTRDAEEVHKDWETRAGQVTVYY